MKGTGVVTVASTVITAAASYSTALSGSHSDPKLEAPNQDRASQQMKEEQRGRQAEDRFTPRFDGLRFIETLVTAHR